MTAKEKDFVNEFGLLLKKYGLKIDSSDDYDHEENICGTDYFFVGNEISLNIRDIESELDVNETPSAP